MDAERNAGGMYVHESGEPGSPAVVFLQGSAASGGMWKDHMKHLRGFHCLAPDLPGFGRSNRMAWRSREATADLVAELIERRVPSRKAHVLGLSWGGGVAHALLARRSDLLDRVIIDSAGILPWWANGPFLAGIAVVAPFLHTRPVVAAISRAVGGMDEAGKEDIRLANREAFRRSFFEGFNVKLMRTELEATCPTLFVCGERETPIRRSNAALAALMPNATARYVPGTGHGWLGTKPELHLAMVEAWFSGAPLPEELAVETIDWPREKVDRMLAEADRLERRRKRTKTTSANQPTLHV